MSNWEEVTLSEVATIARRTVDPSDVADDTAYVGLDNIAPGGTFTNITTVGDAALASTKFRFTKNQVLFGKLRPYLAKIARPEFDGVCSTDILPITPGSRLDRGYLAHFLLQPKVVAQASSKATGANLPRLSPTELGKFRLPLPPLHEQQRIAEVLDRTDELRAKRREALAHLDNLTQSIFLDMFGDPRLNPRRLPVEAFRNLVHEFKYGTSSKSSSTGSPALRIPNVVNGTLDLEDLKTVPVTPAEFDRLRLVDGDVLFVRTNGNPDYVGRCAVFDERLTQGTGFEPNRFIYASYLIRARLNERRIHPTFVQAFMTGVAGRAALRDRCKTSAGQYNLNVENLASVPVPVPPLTEQLNFVERIAKVEAAKSVQRSSLAVLHALFASLQDRAFRGAL